MEVQRAGLGESLKALFQWRGRALVQADSTIIPVVNVAQLEEPPYHNKRGVYVARLVAAVAARFGSIGIAADAGSIVVVRGVVVTNPTGVALSFLAEFGAPTDVTATMAGSGALDWDNRGAAGGGARGATTVRWGDKAAAGGLAVALDDMQLFAQSSVAVGPFVLRPGDSLIVSLKQANQPVHYELFADVYDE